MMDGHRSQLLRVGWRPSYLSTMTLLCTGSGWDEQPLHTPLPSMPWNVHICDRMMGGGHEHDAEFEPGGYIGY